MIFWDGKQDKCSFEYDNGLCIETRLCPQLLRNTCLDHCSYQNIDAAMVADKVVNGRPDLWDVRHVGYDLGPQSTFSGDLINGLQIKRRWFVRLYSKGACELSKIAARKELQQNMLT